MKRIFIYLFKGFKYTLLKILSPIDCILTYFIFIGNSVQFSSYNSHGVPKINVALGGEFSLGSGFVMNNRVSSNPIGRFQRCSFIVGKKGDLSIGNNTGLSATAIVCHNKVTIGNNVKIGGNVVIYDTDFHSLKAEHRLKRDLDVLFTKTAPVHIGDNTFIGAHSTILKGVTIGQNSIIGACSVVTKNIPANEIWAGNPAKKIKELDQ